MYRFFQLSVTEWPNIQPDIRDADRESSMTRKFLIPSGLLAVAVAAGTGLQSVDATAPAPNGETLFRQRCQQCHSVIPGKTTTLGPSLIGVVGRKAASTPFSYSPALKASNLTWNRATLDRFLTAPSRTVPGTRMVISVSDNAQRAALITYLESKR